MVSRSIVIGTAGHIDHGKSALVQALTGINPDRLKEEQARGITIDLGFAHAVIDDVQIAFVDVPGHERFVRNMLAGAGGIDAVILVVAANESVRPQTREHFAICRLLGISRGVVVVSKADLVDDETIELVALDVQELVAGSFLEGAPVVAVSARTGAGLDRLRTAIAALARVAPRASGSGLARLPIDRVFTVKGFGTVVTGTLVSGGISEQDELEIYPERRRARVRGLHVHGRSVRTVSAPQRVALNIAGVDAADVARGMTMAAPDSLAVSRRFDARVHVLPDGRPLRHGARVRVHHDTMDAVGHIAIAAVRATPASEWIAARVGDEAVEIPPGGEGFVRIRLAAPTALTRRDAVVLRGLSPAATLGGGIVLDPSPPVAGLRRATSLDRFRVLDSTTDGGGNLDDRESALIDAWVVEAGMAGLGAQTLVRRGGYTAATAVHALDDAVERGRAVAFVGHYFDAALVADVDVRLRQALAAFHRAEPQADGAPRESLRQRLTGRAPELLFTSIVDQLREQGALRGTDRLSLASHHPSVSDADESAMQAIGRVLRDAGLAPPETGALCASTALSVGAVEEALRRLVRDRRIVRIGALHFCAEALAELKRDIAALARASSAAGNVRLEVGMFKARYQLTRKHAIPLLEYLDRERITRRVGDDRVVL